MPLFLFGASVMAFSSQSLEIARARLSIAGSLQPQIPSVRLFWFPLAERSLAAPGAYAEGGLAVPTWQSWAPWSLQAGV